MCPMQLADDEHPEGSDAPSTGDPVGPAPVPPTGEAGAAALDAGAGAADGVLDGAGAGVKVEEDTGGGV